MKLLCGAPRGGVHSFNIADYVSGIKPIQQRVAVGGTQAFHSTMETVFQLIVVLLYTNTFTISPNTFTGCYGEELSI